MPKVGETVDLEGYRFKVIKAMARQVQMLMVEKLEPRDSETTLSETQLDK